MSLAKLHRTMPTTIWIYPTCCHTFGKSPTNVKDFQKIPTNSKRFHYNLENSNFPGGQSLLGDFSYFYNTWQTECLLPFPALMPFCTGSSSPTVSHTPAEVKDSPCSSVAVAVSR